ncbi:MAG: LPS export ABC transporter periplasmic protein LptC [Proteobacteria bacterium]|nr:LPS export ABC transporter periplasmic protein LptC [Pseudomonadota bacterium]
MPLPREQIIRRDQKYGRYVRRMKRLLPSAAAILSLGMLLWPALRESTSGFTLSFSEIEQFDDKVRMETPRFVGTDTRERSFSVSANSAYHDAGDDQRVMLDVIEADIRRADGSWMALDAPVGIFQPKAEILDLSGQVNVFSDAGYEVHSRQLEVNMGDGKATSTSPVYGQGPFGVFEAGGAEVDVKGDYVLLTNGVKMTVYPKAGNQAKE